MKSLIAALLMCLSASCDIAGGGGSTQQAPEKVKRNESTTIKLELSTQGTVKGRYSDVVCNYRMVGADQYQQLRVEPVAKDKTHEVYEFTIPPTGETGEIEYYFDLKLDGHPSRVNGMQKIKVVDA